MKAWMKVLLITGAVLLLAWGSGLILIVGALVAYATQKKETKFLSRM